MIKCAECHRFRVAIEGDKCNWCISTGKQIYLSHEHYDSPFEDQVMPEKLAHVLMHVGQQWGTYFKTSLKKDGMTVWLWGGVHPVDLASGVRAS